MSKEGAVEMTRLVRPRLGEWKNRRDDRIWKAWVDTFEPDGKGLRGLIEDVSIQDGFKARALMVLLALKEDATGVYWPTSGGSRHLSPLRWSRASLQTLPDKLRSFAIDLLVYAYDVADKMRSPVSRYEDPREDINRYILQFLVVEGYRESLLFSKYRLNDPEDYQSIDIASGYNPWLHLMMDPLVHPVWKLRADTEMRRIIRDEELALTAPRAPWERAIDCYVRHISMMLMSEPGKFPYSIELLRQQIQFIGEVVGNEKRYVASYTTRRLLKLFDSLHYGYRNVIDNAINNAEDPLAIYDGDGLDLARHMQGHLGDKDPLWEKLEDMINAAVPKIIARRTAEASEQMRREEVLSLMRIPEDV